MSENPTPYGSVEIISRSEPVGQIARPVRGWIRAMRDAQNLTLAALARRLKVTPPAVRSFEQAEAEDRITLGSLRRTAAAMGCDLIYALLPRIGTLASPADAVTPSRTGESVESPTPPLKTHDGDHPASKVTDKTWHALHGDS